MTSNIIKEDNHIIMINSVDKKQSLYEFLFVKATVKYIVLYFIRYRFPLYLWNNDKNLNIASR